MFRKNLFRVIAIVFGVFIILQIVGFLVIDLVKVDERQVAVVTRFGKIQDVKRAGWHFKLPWIDQVGQVYQLDTQSKTVEAAAATNDQQKATIKLNVQFKLNSDNISEVYKKVSSQDYLNNVILPPIIQESIKSSSAEYSAVDLLEKRGELKNQIKEVLSQRTREYSLDILAVNVENIDFSDEFDAIIEQKVVAKQEVERQKELLRKAELEIDIERAKAESTKIQGEALRQNPEVIELEKIKKWDGKLPQVQGAGSTIISLEK